MCATLVLLTSFAICFGAAAGPQLTPLVPIAATVWAFAETITATLLLSQFYVNGRVAYAILGVSYAFSALLTVPYVIAFPKLFAASAPSLGNEQLSIYLWMTWHWSFPALAICAACCSATGARIISRVAVRRATAAAVIAPFAAAGATFVAIDTFRGTLPLLLIHGHFQPLLTHALVPSGIALSALACGILVWPGRLTSLALWLSVAIFSDALDLLLTGLSAARYSYAWDTGKVLTVSTASVVLVMILCDIVKLYRRLQDYATTDPLTGLPNRRAFDARYRMVFDNESRLRRSIALLVIDVDFFKRYNDSFGHLAGDACLRQLAGELANCVTGPLDYAARFGGEEFAVLLANCELGEVRATAERLRTAVQRFEMSYNGRRTSGITVSIGIGFAGIARNVDTKLLFETADRALYAAKEAGRNCIRSQSADADLSGESRLERVASAVVILPDTPALR